MSNLFQSFISFIIALFFILLGIISILIPWSSEVRFGLVRFILEDAVTISLFGFAFVVIGLAIALNIWLNSRHNYYLVKSGINPVSVDENVILQYFATYFSELFPETDIPLGLAIKNNKLHFSIDLPYLPILEQKPLLDRIKNDFQDLLAAKLDYHHEFFLAASFKAMPKQNTIPATD